jgi:hypothetical protein
MPASLRRPAVGGIAPDDLRGGQHQGPKAFLADAQRVFGSDLVGDIFMHQHHFNDAAGILLDCVRPGRYPPDRPFATQCGDVIPGGGNADRFALERPRQQRCNPRGNQLGIAQDVVVCAQHEVHQRRAGADMPEIFPCLVDPQRTAVGREDLDADQTLLEQSPEPHAGAGVMVDRRCARVWGRVHGFKSMKKRHTSWHIQLPCACRTCNG